MKHRAKYALKIGDTVTMRPCMLPDKVEKAGRFLGRDEIPSAVAGEGEIVRISATHVTVRFGEALAVSPLNRVGRKAPEFTN